MLPYLKQKKRAMFQTGTSDVSWLLQFDIEYWKSSKFVKFCRLFTYMHAKNRPAVFLIGNVSYFNLLYILSMSISLFWKARALTPLYENV